MPCRSFGADLILLFLGLPTLTFRKPFCKLTGSIGWPEARVSSRTGCSTSSQKLRWALIRLGTFPNRVSADTWWSEQDLVTVRKGQVRVSVRKGQVRTFSFSDRAGDKGKSLTVAWKTLGSLWGTKGARVLRPGGGVSNANEKCREVRGVPGNGALGIQPVAAWRACPALYRVSTHFSQQSHSLQIQQTSCQELEARRKTGAQP